MTWAAIIYFKQHTIGSSALALKTWLYRIAKPKKYQ